MAVETGALLLLTEANRNFSKVVRVVDEEGLTVIPKNNKPRYIVVNFEEYDELQAARAARRQKIEATADQLIEENLEALQELAKCSTHSRRDHHAPRQAAESHRRPARPA